MDSLLSWYQLKIGAYDLQIWERAVELREQQDVGIKSMDKRTSSVKSELIDIDLVRGSTFSKNKPQYSWLVISIQAFIRVLLLPVFARWWIQQTSKPVTLLFVFLYFLQGAVVFLFANGSEKEFEHISTVELMSPCVVMLLVGSIHCHVVSTNFRLHSRPDSRKAKKKRTLSSALLEPVVSSSSQQSTLTLLTTSLNNPVSEIVRERAGDKVSNPCTVGDVCISESNITEEKWKSENVQEKQSIEQITTGTPMSKKSVSSNKKRKASSSTTSSENDSLTRETRLDSTSTDNNDSKRSRHDSLYEELNSTSSGSNSSSNGTESETSSSHETPVKTDKFSHSTRSKHFSATVLLPCSSHGGDRIGVKIWESNQCKKIQASLLDIGSIIRRKVQRAYLPHDMLVIGTVLAGIISLIPGLHRAAYHHSEGLSFNESTGCNEMLLSFVMNIPNFAYGENGSRKTMFLINAIIIERFIISFSFFFMLSAAHKTFRQRLLFAKYFCHLTSSRRAKKSDIPHFRLDKVENVRLWLSLRSYLRRRGPQRSVDIIVSSAFFLSLVLLCFISLQLLHDSEVYFNSLLCWEMTLWLLSTAIFLLNFMTLGVQINKKYRNTSILLTEQINLYLQMKQKPSKKEDLQRVNSVLTIAGKLIKEIETPFNIYGLAMNPLLYNISRVVVLSAFSGVISEMLGFKLKIWKIKP